MNIVLDRSLMFRKVRNIRVRPFYPWRAAMVYTPNAPGLHWLNSAAWLTLELCDGARTVYQVQAAFAELSGREIAGDEIEACLVSLCQKGILEPAGA